jgi:hypothetical protein
MKFPPDKHMLDDGLRDSLLEARPEGVRRMRRTGGHGRNACVTRVATDGYPGLERSTDYDAQRRRTPEG